MLAWLLNETHFPRKKEEENKSEQKWKRQTEAAAASAAANQAHLIREEKMEARMERKSELTPFCGAAAAAFCLMFIAAATKWKTVRGREQSFGWRFWLLILLQGLMSFIIWIVDATKWNCYSLKWNELVPLTYCSITSALCDLTEINVSCCCCCLWRWFLCLSVCWHFWVITFWRWFAWVLSFLSSLTHWVINALILSLFLFLPSLKVNLKDETTNRRNVLEWVDSAEAAPNTHQ